MVEVTLLHALDEGVDLGSRIQQGRAVGMPGIADRDRVVVQPAQFHAGALRVAATALLPADPRQLGRGDPVIRVSHWSTSSRIRLRMSAVFSGGSLSTLSRSMTSLYRSESSR